MITKIVQGDLIKLALEGNFDAIVHGCNCHNVMGAGIAPKIAKAFPGVFDTDKTFCEPVGSIERLGDYSVFSHELPRDRYVDIINAYTQYDFGIKDGSPPVSYKAISEVFKKINYHYSGYVVGIPKIGAGLAGGHWEAIEEIINLVTPNVEIVLVEFSQ